MSAEPEIKAPRTLNHDMRITVSTILHVAAVLAALVGLALLGLGEWIAPDNEE